MLRVLFCALLLISSSAAAFERRAESFTLTHGKAFGPWEVICGYFDVEANAVCDLRYTDVYRARPDFRAWLLFILNSRDAADRPGPVELQLRLEWQSSLVGGGFTSPDGLDVGLSRCLAGGCTLTGEPMQRVLTAMRDGRPVTLTFFDYGFRRQARPIPTDLFAAAWDDFAAQRKLRSLP